MPQNDLEIKRYYSDIVTYLFIYFLLSIYIKLIKSLINQAFNLKLSSYPYDQNRLHLVQLLQIHSPNQIRLE